MRARHRHFNPRHAGAALLFDARKIAGISNNTALETWSDSSGNNRDATQATSAKRPTFKTALFNGNPVVDFDGTNDEMDFASFSAGTEHTCIVAVRSRVATNQFYFGPILHAGGNTDPMYTFGSNMNSGEVGYTISTGGFGTGSLNIANGVVACTKRNGTAIDVFANRTKASGTLPANTVAVAARIGMRNSLFYNGEIGQIVFFNSTLSDSNIRKITDAAAFSFKVACN
jgi:hypothetical protein